MDGGSDSLLKGHVAQGRVAGVDSQEFDHAASHLGKAVGIANLLRGTAYHAARSASSWRVAAGSACM